MATAEKLCPKCRQVKPAVSFYVSPKRGDGLSSYCRQCQIHDAQARYNPHPRYHPPEGMKWCRSCQQLLPKESFGRNRASYDRLQSRCKPCSVASVTASRRKNPQAHRDSSKRWSELNPQKNLDARMKLEYGLPPGSYNAMFAAQNGRCAICGTNKPGGGAKRLAVDHCHATARIRGLLCSSCNHGLGRFKDNSAALRAAADYVDKYSETIRKTSSTH